MKCPNCGREIPDGSLFCEYCAAEIKIVPEYEPNLEDQISSGMETVKQTLEDADASNPKPDAAVSDETIPDTRVPEEEPVTGTRIPAAERTPAPSPAPHTGSRRERLRRRARLVLFFLVGALSTAAVMIVLYIALLGREEHSQSYYVGRAYQSASEGRYQDAADEIDNAIRLTDSSETGGGSGTVSAAASGNAADASTEGADAAEGSDNQTDATLYLLKAEYLQKAGEKNLALGAASRVLDSAQATEDDIIAAYGRMISIYASYEEYDKIAELLATCSYPSVVQNYLQYALFDPEFSMKGGVYQDSVTLELSDEGDGSIFYTLDGSTPTTASVLYTEPIVLSGGTCTVSAVYVNHFGLQSNVVQETFTIDNEAPAAPVIAPKSGTYAKKISITASFADGTSPVSEDGSSDAGGNGTEDGTIYYTTDGTDPTTESTEYTGPIDMPQGSSIFRFAVIGSNGRSSDVVEREYTYNITTAINAADGVNYILVALIQRGEIINTIGTRPDGLTMYTFSYTGMTQIGDVSYLLYSETLVDSTGAAEATGRNYAVNAINGTVNLYDGSTLTPIG